MPKVPVKITLIGGPTAVVEFCGLRFLTDPTFDGAGHDYASGAVTLTKVTSPAIPVEAIGAIDAVVLSHDQHPDNLDTAHAFPGALIIPIHTEGWAHYTQSAQELEAASGAQGNHPTGPRNGAHVNLETATRFHFPPLRRVREGMIPSRPPEASFCSSPRQSQLRAGPSALPETAEATSQPLSAPPPSGSTPAPFPD